MSRGRCYLSLWYNIAMSDESTVKLYAATFLAQREINGQPKPLLLKFVLGKHILHICCGAARRSRAAPQQHFCGGGAAAPAPPPCKGYLPRTIIVEIGNALSKYDHHFEQAGFRALLRE